MESCTALLTTLFGHSRFSSLVSFSRIEKSASASGKPLRRRPLGAYTETVLSCTICEYNLVSNTAIFGKKSILSLKIIKRRCLIAATDQVGFNFLQLLTPRCRSLKFSTIVRTKFISCSWEFGSISFWSLWQFEKFFGKLGTAFCGYLGFLFCAPLGDAFQQFGRQSGLARLRLVWLCFIFRYVFIIETNLPRMV